MRVKIFVDFWNFQLGWNSYHRRQGTARIVQIPWEDRLPQVLTNLAGTEASYAGTHVYASIDPRSEADKGLKRFLQVMDGFPGYAVTVKERQVKGAPRCSNKDCRKEITHCPHCNERLRRTIEKGVDTALVVDMIQLAMDDIYDRGVLLSADKDHAGAVNFIQNRMKQITNVGFGGEGQTLRNACWNHFTFDSLMAELLQPKMPAP